MASKYDAARDRRKNSEERINQIVASYPSPSSGSSSQSQESKYTKARNRQALPPSDLPNTVLPSLRQQVENIDKVISGKTNNPPVKAIVDPTDQLNAALNFTAPRPAPPSPIQRQDPQSTGIPSFQQQVQNIQSQVGNGQSAEDQWLQEQLVREQERGQKYPVYAAIDKVLSPVTRLIEKAQVNTPGYAAFQQGASNATGTPNFGPPVTGSPWINKPAELIGGIAGLASVPAGGAGQNALSAPMQIGQKLTRDISNPLARVTARGVTEGTLGGLTGSLAAGQSDADELSRNALLGGLLGLGGEALAGLPGALARNARNAATGITRGNVNTASAIESAANSVPTGRLRVEGNTEKLSRLIEDIRPVVTERMTPPLENQAQLAKWLQPHLNASLNQIRKLSYEDMRQLATEVQRSLSVEDTARQVARERGVDLDALLNQTAPTFQQQAERLRLGGVAGAIEPPQNVRVALSGNEPYQPNTAAAATNGTTQSWFEALFGNRGLGATAGSKDARSISDTIVKTNIRETPKNAAQKAISVAKDAHKALVNRFEPLKRAGNNVFETAEDSMRANQIANQIIGKEFVTPEGQVVGEGFQKLMQSVPRGKDRTFFDYLIIKDAQARVPRGERVYDESIKIADPNNPNNMLELNSEDGLAVRRAQLEQQNPWLPALSQRWNEFTRNLRQIYGINEGLISDELNTALETARPDYIKMMRQFSREERPQTRLFGSSAAESFSGKKGPIQSVNKHGSARKIVDPRKTMAESVGQWVNNAMRNRVAQELVRNVQSDPDAFKGIAEIIPDTLTNQQTGGVFKNKINNRENVVTAMVGGNPVNVRVLDPEIVTAMKGLEPTQLGLVLRVAKAGSDFTKRSATGVLAPAFAAKSAVVDLPTSLIQAKGNRVRFLGDYVHALASGFASKLGNNRLAQLAKDYERAGGGFSAALRGEKSLNTAVKNLERNPILSGKNVLRTTGAAIKAPFRVTESIANVFENAPRIAAAKGELRRLGGQRTPENIRKAMQEGREITVNYSRKGSVSDELEAISPYTNAAIQGLSRVARQIKNKPLQTLTGVTLIVGLPKAYEYMQFSDDPDYERLPAREKFRNLIISKNADGTFNKIPLEPSYAAFGAAALDFYKYVKDNDPEAFKGMTDSLANAYTPPLLSGALQGLTQGGEGKTSQIEKSGWGIANATSFGPLIGTLANQSFTGAPIDNAAVSDRSPQYRYDEKTSSIAKWVGDKLNFSPMKTDYLLKQYGGDLARIGLPVFSDVGSGTKQQTLLRNFIVDPVFTNNLTNDYYTGKSLLSTAEKDNAEVGAPLPPWYNENLAKELSTTKKGSITSRLKDLTAQKKITNADKALTASEKAQKLRSIQRQINDIYIDVNSKMQDAGVPLPRR